MQTKNDSNQFYRVELLEPRLLLAADWLAGLAPAWAADGDPHSAHSDLGDYLADRNEPAGNSRAPLALPGALDLNALLGLQSQQDAADNLVMPAPGSDPVDAMQHELVVIDAGVEGHEELIADFEGRNGGNTYYDVHVLEADADGMQALTTLLAGYSDLDAVHIVSHGSDGGIQLGDTRLDGASIDSYAETLRSWSTALGDDADVLIYGCSLAASEGGQALVETLGSLTGADVAASTDATGQAQFGGDWNFEYNLGDIDSQIAFSKQIQSDWSGLLALFTVDSLDDTVDVNPGDGLALDAFGNTSLRAAIMEANALPGVDTINLPSGTYALSISGDYEDGSATGDLDLLQDVTIVGAGAASTIIDADGLDRVFEVIGAINVSISGLTIQGGDSGTEGGGISNGGGTLSLTSVTVGDNSAGTRGGGIYNDGDLTLDSVTISGNHAASPGGGIFNETTASGLLLTNVTVSGNTSDSAGGGLQLLSDATLLNVTITGNDAGSGGGGIKVVSGSTTLHNSIVAGNTAAAIGPDVNGTVVSDGSNIVLDGAGSSGFLVGETGVDPLLDPVLRDNGGPTWTHALLAGSPAINSVAATGAPVYDQRGYIRDGSPDIGAYEFGANGPPVANDDGYSVSQDTTLTVDAILGLLANDTDADFDPLTLRLLTGPSNGSLTLNPIGLTNLLNLSMNVSNDIFVSWSPDGSQLAFASDQDGDDEIYVINADGTGLQQLTSDGSSERQPVWSPDGTQILYRSDSDGTFDIWVMDANGENPLRLTSGAAADGASEKDAVWSPDGTRIVYVMDQGQDSIYVMNADGSNPQLLTSPAARDFSPEWSPDGSSIVFMSDRDGNDEIYVMEADGSNVNRLTTNATIEGAPTWSPDGSRILFHSNADGDFELYAMDADGSNVIQITNNTFADRRAVWSPDGTQIAFQTNRDGNNEIYVADIVSDGAFSYTPDPGFTGVDSFTYVVSDGTTESAPATVTLTVGALAQDDMASVDEDGSVNIDVIANDNDPGSGLTVLGFERVVAAYNAGTTGMPPDPTSGPGGGWSLNENEDGNISTGNLTANGVISDGGSGLDAWNVRDETNTVGQHLEYSLALSPADKALADAYGWELSAQVRMVDDYGDTRAVFFNYGNGLDRFPVLLDLDANGDLTVFLNGTGGGTYTLTTGGTGTAAYHDFEIVYDPGSGTAAVLVDGVRVDGGAWQGTTSLAAYFDGVWWGVSNSAGQGTANFHSIEMRVFDQSITSAQGATVSNNGDGTIGYTPAPEFNGVDSFSYTVRDADGNHDVGKVTVTVNPVNDAPSFSTLGDQNVLEDSGPYSVAGFATALPGGGADESGQTFTYSVSSDNPGLFLVDPAIDASGALTYTLNANAVGTATVTVSVTDSGGTANGGVDTSSDQTFDIIVGAVNDVPSFSTLGDQNVLEDSGPHTVVGFATALPGGGTDESGQTFTYTVSSDNPGLFLVGPIIDASGTLTYTLNPNKSGTATVTVSVTDSGGTANGGVDTSADQTFDITVGAVNDAPSFSTLGDQNVLEDSGPHTVVGFATALPGGGTDESGQTFTYNVSSDNPGLFLVGPAIDASGTLTYTLNPNVSGTTTITVSVTDSGGTANGGVDTSADQTFDIVVGAVNDAPSFSTLGDQNVLEDSGPHTVVGFATALPGGGTDESGQTFTYNVSSDNAGLFLVGPAIDASGTLTYTLNPDAVGTTTITVSVTDSGGTANGGVDTSADQTFDIVVGAVNDAPTFSTLGDQNVLEDSGPHTVVGFATALPGGGTDESGQTFTYNVSSDNPGLFLVGPAIDASGTLTYTLNPNVSGTTTITVSVTDSGGTANGGVDTSADQTFDIVVGAVNDAPSFSTLGDQNVLEDSGPHTVVGFATALPGGGTDESGQTFTYNVSSDNPGLFLVGPAIDASGTLTYTLNPNVSGTTTITVSVTDSGGTANGGVDTSADQTFDIVVGAVNDAPSFSTLGDQNVLEDSGPHTVVGFATALPGGGTDESGQTFTYNVSSDNPGLFLVGPAIDASGTLTYTLNPNVSGTTTITVSVTDSGGTANGGVDTSADQTFDIVVVPVSNTPVATNLNQVHLYLEDAGSVSLTDITVADSDVGDLITATLTFSDPGAGSLTYGSGNGESYAAGTGVWTVTGTVAQVNAALAAVAFVPATDNTASTTIITHIEDLAGQGPADGLITLDVIPVNDAPAFAILGDQSVLEDSGPHTIVGFLTALPGGGSDEASQTFTYTVSSDNPGLFLVGPAIDANGTLTYTLNPNANGTATVTLSVTDSGGTSNGGVDTSADQTFDISVVPVNDAPTFSTLGDQNVLEDSGSHTVVGFATALPGGGTDESGQTFTYSVSADNPGLFLVGPSIDANGTLTYTLNAGVSGTARIAVVVTDSGGTTNGGDNDSASQAFDLVVTQLDSVPVATNLDQMHLYIEDSGPVGLHDILVNAGGASGLVTATLTLSDTSTGDLSASSGNGETYTSTTGVWTITGTVSQVNTALAAVTFVPVSDNDLSTTLSTHIENASGQGPADGLITLGVTPVNDPPSGGDGLVGINGDSVYVFTVPNFGYSDLVEGDAMLAVQITSLPAGVGTLTNNGAIVSVGDIVSATDINAGYLRFVPAPGFEQTVSGTIGFRVQDAGGTVAGGIDFDPGEKHIILVVNPAPEHTVGPGVDGWQQAQSDALGQSDVDASRDNRLPANTSFATGKGQLIPAKPQFNTSFADDRIAPEAVDIPVTRAASVVGFPVFRTLAQFLSGVDDDTTNPELNQQVALIEGSRDSGQLLNASADDIRSGLEQLRSAVAQDNADSQFAFGRSASAVLGLSVGYVSWLLRGGVLLSSVLSSLPVWRFVDPLPVFARERDRRDEDGDDESLEAIVQSGNENDARHLSQAADPS